ncbi:arylamine N-acetyltransferase family protein [Streptomyces lanatus]|uniref:Arylamine N-acetyltransferase n=1 Tax=Streptomyces lanatus TaxID=66900 RepID=A0ABV1Y729_9ACTN|nr:arylamine N-acetyltransferase [Streptomyces lanatus]GHH19691.1 acetyltransferase [Streptomyces lanatus]
METVALPWREYLDRIGHSGRTEPTLECLRELYTAHLRSVPYEMLDVFDGTPPVLDHETLFRKLVRERRGGNCLESTPLFGELLSRLGFTVRLVPAQIWKVSGEWWEAWDHLLLIVTVDGTDWLVDVGFLMPTFARPLEIADGPQQQDGWTYRVAAQDGYPTVSRQEPDGSWTPVYRFRDEPQRQDDYAWIIAFHEQTEDSPLVGTMLCARNVPDGKLIVIGENLLTARHGRVTAEFIETADRAEEVLREIFAGHDHLVGRALKHWDHARSDRTERRNLMARKGDQ